MPDAVLFDLDGTFADTALDLGEALNRLRREDDLDDLPISFLRPHASHGVRGLLRAGFGISQEDTRYTQLATRFLEYYANALCARTVLFDGIEALVDALEVEGIRWGIVTNKLQRYTLPLMAALGLSRRPGCIVSGDSSPRSKPYPEPLFLAARLLDAVPERCVYVGDDLRDVQAARAARMTAVAAAYGYLGSAEPIECWGADRIIDTPGQILEVVRRGR